MKKRKVKLFASIASLGLVVAVMGVGVWAATQQAVKVSSQVSFTATSVAADIKLSINNAATPKEGDADFANATKYAQMKEYDIVKDATLSRAEEAGEDGKVIYVKSKDAADQLYSEAKIKETTDAGTGISKYDFIDDAGEVVAEAKDADAVAYGEARKQPRRIAYFNNDTAKTLYENRVYLNLQDKDEDGYLNIGAKVVYEFTIKALESSAPIYYHVTANLFDTDIFTPDAIYDPSTGTSTPQEAVRIQDAFEVQIFDVSTTAKNGDVTLTDQTAAGIEPSSNATKNERSPLAGLGNGDDVTDDDEAEYPTALLSNWTHGDATGIDTTEDDLVIMPGETRTIHVVYTVKDMDGDKVKVPTNTEAKDLYQGISYTMKSLELGDIYIKLANNGNNIAELPNYVPGIDETAKNDKGEGFDKFVDWITGKEDKPE